MRANDLVILLITSIASAAAKGLISAYTILSPTVYGQGTGFGNSESETSAVK
jgi:hypothetical protein